jgi:hypothetical protein
MLICNLAANAHLRMLICNLAANAHLRMLICECSSANAHLRMLICECSSANAHLRTVDMVCLFSRMLILSLDVILLQFGGLCVSIQYTSHIRTCTQKILVWSYMLYGTESGGSEHASSPASRISPQVSAVMYLITICTYMITHIVVYILSDAGHGRREFASR